MSSAAAGKIEDRDHFTFGWGRRVCPGSLLVCKIDNNKNNTREMVSFLYMSMKA